MKMTNKNIMLLTLIVCLLFTLVGCGAKETIKVGFSAQLTGKQAELGVQERNAVQMAVDEINSTGGINNRQIELIIKDDLGTSEGAALADKALINSKVVCIIGHATSAQTMAALPITEESKTVLFSPTTSTQLLTGKDDYFIRIVPTVKDRAAGFSKYIFNKLGIKTIAVMYDTDNNAYSKSFWDCFSDSYKAVGGKVVGEKAFSSTGKNDFDEIIKNFRNSNAAGIMLVTSDNDAAFIVQKIRLQQWNVPIFSSAWAQTDTLIKNGGKAVDGMLIEQTFPLDSQSSNYLEFKKKFINRYAKEPTFAAAYAYETMQVIGSALLKTNGQAAGLKTAIINIKDFQGLVDKFSFDKYGDVVSPFYLGKIENGKFVDIESFLP